MTTSKLTKRHLRETTLYQLRNALSKRQARNMHRSCEIIAARYLKEILEGGNQNAIDIDLETLVSSIPASNDIAQSAYSVFKARLGGYDESRLTTDIFPSGSANPHIGPSGGIFEIHIKKSGSDEYGIGTDTQPLKSLGEALRRLPSKIDIPVVIYLHADPTLDAVGVQTVYADDAGYPITKIFEFGSSPSSENYDGSIAIVGRGNYVTDEALIGTVPALLNPAAGREVINGADMISSEHAGKWLKETSSNLNVLGLANNNVTSLYTRGSQAIPVSVETDFQVIRPGVKVHMSSLSISISSHNRRSSQFAMFNLEVDLRMPGQVPPPESGPIPRGESGDPNYLSSIYPIRFIGRTHRDEMLLDFVRFTTGDTEPYYRSYACFENVRLNYLPAQFRPTPETVGNSLEFWLGDDYETESLGTSFGHTNNDGDVTSVHNSRSDLQCVTASNGLDCVSDSTNRRSQYSRIVVRENQTEALDCSIHGVNGGDGILLQNGGGIFQSITFFDGGSTQNLFNSYAGIFQIISATSQPTIPGYCIYIKGASHITLSDDPSGMVTAMDDIYFDSALVPSSPAFPLIGTDRQDSTGSHVVWTT